MNQNLEQLAKEAYKFKLSDFTPLGIGSVLYACRNHYRHKQTEWKFYEENFLKTVNRLGVLTMYNGMQVVGLLSILKQYYES